VPRLLAALGEASAQELEIEPPPPARRHASYEADELPGDPGAAFLAAAFFVLAFLVPAFFAVAFLAAAFFVPAFLAGDFSAAALVVPVAPVLAGAFLAVERVAAAFLVPAFLAAGAAASSVTGVAVGAGVVSVAASMRPSDTSWSRTSVRTSSSRPSVLARERSMSSSIISSACLDFTSPCFTRSFTIASARDWVICVNAIPASRYRLIRGFLAIRAGYGSTGRDESASPCSYALAVLPLKDVNPTSRRPVVTLLVILACIGAWVFWQEEPQREPVEDLVFNLEHTAIPCELTQGRPLTEPELEATFGTLGGDPESCGIGADDAPLGVPDKSVWLSAFASMFLHGGFMHIAGNMLYLWIFGNNIEDHLGRIRYLLFYVVGGLAALATHVVLQPDSTIPLVGASGAVAAIMGAYLIWFPDAPVRTIVLLGFPILATIKAKWLLGVWFVLQFFTSPNAGVAWAAHVGGFVFGVVIGLLVRSTRAAQRVAWRGRYQDQMAPHHWDATGGAGPVQEYQRWRSRG
jgi:membrane associated rhomboid family serine protease